MAEEEMPLSLGVWADTGEPLSGISPEALIHIGDDPQEVIDAAESGSLERLTVSWVDATRLSEAGWGILFAKGADTEVRRQLDPLIQHRKSGIADPRLFKEFAGDAGYRHGDTARAWLGRYDCGYGEVNPVAGVPLYILLVGPPDEIPFEFQYELDLYWCVGRLCFDRPEDYGAYARSVVQYETAKAPSAKKRAVLFCTRNLADPATQQLHDQLALVLETGSATLPSLSAASRAEVTTLLAERASRQNLLAALADLPAVLFTGSHGAAYPFGHAEQRERQGAIVCQSWQRGIAPTRDDCVDAADLTNLRLDGLIHFFFACYSGGTPKYDTYSYRDGTPRQIAERPFVSAWARRALAKGALAVVSHVDQAWSSSFQFSRRAPQVQEFLDVLVKVLKGVPVGLVMDVFNRRWSVLSAELLGLKRQREASTGEVADAALANRWTARDDARNFMLFGDPAVRLRIDSLVNW